MNLRSFYWGAAIAASVCFSRPAQTTELAPGVRGLATHAPAGMKIDGDLSEWKEAFSTPVDYFNANLKNRAGQFFYMWDDEAFYAALRTLDQKPANNASDKTLWEGDAVEWYFDTRRNADFRGKDWGKGAVHCYWTGLKGTNVHPRFCLRPGYLDAIPKIGVEVGARRTPAGMEVEFKMPWANFPEFKPKAGEVISLDAELCSSDGGPRVYRSFVYGSPLSVQQPASQAPIQLVEKFERAFWSVCAPVMAPVRCDTPWTSKEKGIVVAYMALPPTHSEDVAQAIFQLSDLQGKSIAEFAGLIEKFASEGNFKRARTSWHIDVAPPGTYHLTGILRDKSGRELGRVAPRMVSVNMSPGY
jgi:hypothetical protein